MKYIHGKQKSQIMLLCSTKDQVCKIKILCNDLYYNDTILFYLNTHIVCFTKLSKLLEF